MVLNMRFDLPSKYGCRAFATNGNCDRCAINESRRYEITCLEIVDNIDQHTGGMAKLCNARILFGVVMSCVDQAAT